MITRIPCVPIVCVATLLPLRTVCSNTGSMSSSFIVRKTEVFESSEFLSSRAVLLFFFSSRRRHTRFDCDWSSDVCSSDLVSHQSYVHKLLTGRKSRFQTIRTTDGLNGFSLRTESEHDCYGAGRAGTALSAALGMAAARDQRGSNEHIISIFGDAALTNGISFEALNNIAHTTKRFIGILNDNEWSIAKNVGAIASYLNKLITNPRYNKLQKEFERWVKRMPKGEFAVKFG